MSVYSPPADKQVQSDLRKVLQVGVGDPLPTTSKELAGSVRNMCPTHSAHVSAMLGLVL